MKALATFLINFLICLGAAMIAWDALVMGRFYYCADEVGFDFFSPGNWVHGELAIVPQIDPAGNMSDPDQIRAGWTTGRLWTLWSLMLACCFGTSFAGALLGSRRGADDPPIKEPKAEDVAPYA